MIGSWYVAETGYLEVRGFSLASGMQQCSGDMNGYLRRLRYRDILQTLRSSDPRGGYLSLFRSNPIPCNRSHIYMNGTLREQPPTSDSAIITDCQWQPA